MFPFLQIFLSIPFLLSLILHLGFCLCFRVHDDNFEIGGVSYLIQRVYCILMEVSSKHYSSILVMIWLVIYYRYIQNFILSLLCIVSFQSCLYKLKCFHIHSCLLWEMCSRYIHNERVLPP
jgi:hypothetical protein